MKNLKFIFATAILAIALVFAACKKDDDKNDPNPSVNPSVAPDPSEELPLVEATDGAVTLVVKFVVGPCEGYYIDFAGHYKDHNWGGEGDGEKFTDMGGGWYKVVLFPDEEGNLEGRPCMVNSPDQAWNDYHWTADIENLEGLEDAVKSVNEFGQLNLNFGALYNGEVIYVKATGWAASPCVSYLPAGSYTFTANLPEPLPEGAVLIITGTFADKSWGDSDREMTKVTDTQYTWTGEVPDEFQWKVFYVLDGAQVWATNTNHHLLTEADLVETVEWPAPQVE